MNNRFVLKAIAVLGFFWWVRRRNRASRAVAKQAEFTHLRSPKEDIGETDG